jgi:adenylate kinase family enzyme
VRRVSVIGVSGSGKTTVARQLAEALDVPHVELDAIFHQPGWTSLPDDEFRSRVAALVAGDGWVVDGSYAAVRPLVWVAADTVVWLDPSRARVMRRLVARTARRGVLRQELWNGDRERVFALLRRSEADNLALYAWRKHPVYRARYADAVGDPPRPGLRFVRLGTDAQVDAFIASARLRPRP